ncbi:MAG: ABC transporter ATP-binding protein [Magnetococcales bacterium]|nr:ABC transporter ATP-binding protein [Magnetococcales bacterium]
MIEIRHLTKRFRWIKAVDDISFEVNRGEVLGFLGPNGAGKSTTMKMITGFLSPTAGFITIAGRPLRQDPLAAKRRIGYLPEGAPAWPDMTPESFLGFIAGIRGFSGAERRRRIEATIERVHLGPVRHQPIETLSKGFKRRVGLAQAILHDPEILIMDEPTDGLDPNQKQEVRALIRDMAADKAIILSTHILEEVRPVCTRVAVIARGRLLADESPAAFEARSRLHNAVTLTLARPDPGPVRQALGLLGGVAGVDTLAEDASGCTLRILPQPGQVIAAAVGRLAQEQGWPVAGLFVDRGHLEEAFRVLTTRSDTRGEA